MLLKSYNVQDSPNKKLHGQDVSSAKVEKLQRAQSFCDDRNTVYNEKLIY